MQHLSLLIIPCSYRVTFINRLKIDFTKEVSIILPILQMAKTETQTKEVTCTRSPSRTVAETGSDPRPPESQFNTLSITQQRGSVRYLILAFTNIMQNTRSRYYNTHTAHCNIPTSAGNFNWLYVV